MGRVDDEIELTVNQSLILGGGEEVELDLLACGTYDDDDDESAREDDKPDVIVVVGGQEYHEHSKHLCYWSKYFETAFKQNTNHDTSQLNTSTATAGVISRRFEFPDRQAHEWEIARQLMVPLTQLQIDMYNLEVVTYWSHRLAINWPLEKCDAVLSDFIQSRIRGHAHCTGVLKLFPFCMQYRLPRAKQQWFAYVVDNLKNHESLVTLSQLEIIASHLRRYKECRLGLQDTLKDYFPETMECNDDLFQNPLLTSLLHANLQLQARKRQLGEYPEAEAHCFCCQTNFNLRKALERHLKGRSQFHNRTHQAKRREFLGLNQAPPPPPPPASSTSSSKEQLQSQEQQEQQSQKEQHQQGLVEQSFNTNESHFLSNLNDDGIYEYDEMSLNATMASSDDNMSGVTEILSELKAVEQSFEQGILRHCFPDADNHKKPPKATNYVMRRSSCMNINGNGPNKAEYLTVQDDSSQMTPSYNHFTPTTTNSNHQDCNKSVVTTKSIGTTKSAVTTKSGGSIKSGGTLMSAATNKSGRTIKSIATNKSGGTIESIATNKSGATTKSTKSIATNKSIATTKSLYTTKSGGTSISCETPRHENIRSKQRSPNGIDSFPHLPIENDNNDTPGDNNKKPLETEASLESQDILAELDRLTPQDRVVMDSKTGARVIDSMELSEKCAQWNAKIKAFKAREALKQQLQQEKQEKATQQQEKKQQPKQQKQKQQPKQQEL